VRAMLLAAGRGERMRPLTDTCPKALLEVGGKPLIAWHIERLVRAGVREFVVNLAHLGWMIRERLGDGARFGARIAYSEEGEALETAGGIAHALALLTEPVFLALSADVFTDYPFERLLPRWRTMLAAEAPSAHLVLVGSPSHKVVWEVGLEGERVVRGGSVRMTYAGIGLFRREAFEGWPARTARPLRELLDPWVDARALTGEAYPGRWFDVGTPERLERLRRDVAGTAGAAAKGTDPGSQGSNPSGARP
jgi:MurNAc alpha-1-phosphate uridylyltransferase